VTRLARHLVLVPVPVPVLLFALACSGAPSSTKTTSPAAPTSCPSAAVRVHAQRELDALRGCATLAGLELRGAVPFDLAPLESLTSVDGDLAVRSTFALGSLRLPALERVTGAVIVVSNLNMSGVYLPALASAGSVTITDGPPLVQIMLPALTRVDGDVTFARLPSLELVDLSTLPAVGGRLSVEGAARIEIWLGPTEATRPGSQP